MSLRLLVVVFMSAWPSMASIDQVQQAVFYAIADLAKGEEKTFCRKGVSILQESIRAHSGMYCQTPLGAALAVQVCEGSDPSLGFAGSTCKTTASAIKKFGISSKTDIRTVFANPEFQATKEDFIALCQTVTSILPDKENECNEKIDYFKHGITAPLVRALPITLKSWSKKALEWAESTSGGAVVNDQYRIDASQFDTVLRDFAQNLVNGPIASSDQWLDQKPPEGGFYNIDTLGTTNAGYKDKVFFGQKVVIPANSKIIVMGDFHGSLHSLLRNLWRLRGLGYIDSSFKIIKNDTYIVFTGDFVDRGRYSIEVLYTLLKLKVANPNNVFLLRGNHENETISRKYGLLDELQAKYGTNRTGGDRLFKDIIDFYRFLPVVLFMEVGGPDNSILHFSHGGFSYDADRDWLKHSPAALLKDKRATFELIPAEQAKGYMWSDFYQADESLVNTDRGFKYGSEGVAVLGKNAIEEYAKEIFDNTNKPLAGIFRGHQDRAFGFKLLFKEQPTYSKLEELAKKNRTYPGGPYNWLDVATIDISKARTSGINIKDFRPVYTFTSAAEGQALPFDAFGIIKAKNGQEFSLEVHEIPLDGRKLDMSYVSISPGGPTDDQISATWSPVGPGRLFVE